MMKDIAASSSTFGVVISLVAYFAGYRLNRRFHRAVLNPMLVAIVAVAAFLLLFDIDLEIYNESAHYLSYLLTPATVCLAVPMYKNLEILRRQPLAIFCGILGGVLTSLLSVLLFCLIFSLDDIQYLTLLPKSITTAIGAVLSEELGGISAITTAVIIITGIIGNISADMIWKLFHITDPVARGISLGTAAHAIGTSKAMETGETEGAMSSLSIVISGLCTVVLANLFKHAASLL